MGRNKDRLRIGSRTMLSQVRARAREIGSPVRVIRRDLVSRCGPIGGIYTALTTSRADAELFLACDMPFVAPALIRKLMKRLSPRADAVFTLLNGVAGFPFLIRVGALPRVSRQIKLKQLSLQSLARALRAKLISPSRRQEAELFNINTPDDWHRARTLSAQKPSRTQNAPSSPLKNYEHRR
jgi:molybdopterin-guanine dinucleotide biosynthesis protein A